MRNSASLVGLLLAANLWWPASAITITDEIESDFEYSARFEATGSDVYMKTTGSWVFALMLSGYAYPGYQGGLRGGGGVSLQANHTATGSGIGPNLGGADQVGHSGPDVWYEAAWSILDVQPRLAGGFDTLQAEGTIQLFTDGVDGGGSVILGFLRLTRSSPSPLPVPEFLGPAWAGVLLLPLAVFEARRRLARRR